MNVLLPEAVSPPEVRPLLDSFGRRHTYLRLSVTDRCNLRCLYCAPPGAAMEASAERALDREEILRLVGLFAQMGVDKVRLTGGEPLLRDDICDLARGIASIPGIATLAMTTNGVMLQEKIRALRASGLTRLTISLDTLRPERFERIACRALFDRVRTGIEAALEAGFAPLKLNVVALRGINDDELLDFSEIARRSPICVRFIERMPFAGGATSRGAFLSASEMRERIARRIALIPIANLERANDAAAYFSASGFAGEIGFIAPVSQPFCRRCNRLRLTAGGSLRTCLTRPADAELGKALRAGASDDTLVAMIREALEGKKEAGVSLKAWAGAPRQNMSQIGG